MRATLSFHPLDLSFVDEIVAPLLRGDKTNPERFLADAMRLRHAHWQAGRYIAALEQALDDLQAPPVAVGASLVGKLRGRLDALRYRPDPTSVRVSELVQPELHLYGRPFLITEGSAERVADVVDDYRSAGSPDDQAALVREQLIRLDAELAQAIEPIDGVELGPEAHYRSDLLAQLRELYDLAAVARDDVVVHGDDGNGARVPGAPLSWRAIAAHARAMPYWVGAEVDGLVTICHAAGVEAPPFLEPASRAFGEAWSALPARELGEGREVARERDLGAYVAPPDVPDLVDFLGTHGSRIIQAASRHGEGPACEVLLRKIRECACYAARHGLGYLEASGLAAPDFHEYR